MSGTRRLPTYYDILGVPPGVGADHIKDSYHLLTRKTQVTDLAYETLIDPERRVKYDHWIRDGCSAQPQIDHTQEEQRWGKRGRERCSCGRLLEVGDEWLCRECWERLDYFVVFGMFGGFVVHESQLPIATESDDRKDLQAPSGTCFGPFTQEEAEAFLVERNKMRDRV